MTSEPDRFRELRDRLLRQFAGAAPEVHLLAEGQAVVRKNMVPNPAAGQGLKAAAEVPGPDGYEVYAARRRDDPAAMPAQRAAPPPAAIADPAAVMLRLEEGVLRGDWNLRTPDGLTVSVSARCGSPAVRDEVNQILTTVVAVLL
jgi:hypothetical protein